MPLVRPNKGEKESAFVGRCMKNQTMVREFNRPDQRQAVCHNQFRRQQKQSKPKRADKP